MEVYSGRWALAEKLPPPLEKIHEDYKHAQDYSLNCLSQSNFSTSILRSEEGGKGGGILAGTTGVTTKSS